jgi:hypothetical protein
LFAFPHKFESLVVDLLTLSWPNQRQVTISVTLWILDLSREPPWTMDAISTSIHLVTELGQFAYASSISWSEADNLKANHTFNTIVSENGARKYRGLIVVIGRFRRGRPEHLYRHQRAKTHKAYGLTRYSSHALV